MKILHTADWHLRADTPRCRQDPDWIETQRRAIREIVETANKLKASLSIGGDIFHTPTVSAKIVNMFLDEIKLLNRPASIMAGNHDLPYHSWTGVLDSSFGTLWTIATGKSPSILYTLSALGDYINFGSTLGESNPGLAYLREDIKMDLLFLHELVFRTAKDLPPTDKAKTATELLAEYPDYKVILLGDNHHSWEFVAKTGRAVLNPGCLTRQDASFIDYQPGAWLLDSETFETEWIPLTADLENGAVVTDAYLKTQEERENRIASFVESVQSSGKISLSFEDNLLEFLEYNRDSVQPETAKYLTGLVKGEL